MSTEPAPAAPRPQKSWLAQALGSKSTDEIAVYHHATLFYWWPVWACGFIMCIVTLIDGGRMAVVPSGSEAVKVDKRTVGSVPGGTELQTTQTGQNLLILPANGSKAVSLEPKPEFRMMSRNRDLGLVFATVLLATILSTSVPLRGLWSVVLVLFVVLVIVILALTPWLTRVINAISLIDIRINVGGYCFISAVLLIMWILAVFVFDRRMYMAITSGQVRVCTAIGTGETVYDTAGLTFQKRQDDLFRHWIIGLGSGDLILHRTNVNQEIDFPNVLFIGGKIREIEKLIKEKEVV